MTPPPRPPPIPGLGSTETRGGAAEPVDLFVVLGIVLVAVGVGMIDLRAGLIAGGVLILGASVLYARGRERPERTDSR